jgi:hypothetical protein
MSQYSFGSGALWGTPLQDAAGNAISNPTPLLFGTLQDISIDMSFETKTLHGQNQFPVAVGRGKGKITGKAKYAQISGAMFNSLFFGQTMTAGLLSANYDTTGVLIPASSPYTVTVTPANSGVWSQDLGVIDANGQPMTRVASAPASGQYSVAAGVYTFAAGDTGKKVYVNYQYTATSTTSRKSTVQNVQMGYAPTFRADFSVSYQGKSLTMSLPSCIASKLGFGAKNDDFSVPEFDFEAFADPAGNVLTWSTTE